MSRTARVVMIAGGVMTAAQLVAAGPMRGVVSGPSWNRIVRMGVLPGGGGTGGGGFGGPTDSLPFTENFDSYAAGPWPCLVPGAACSGPNGWQLWGITEASSLGVPGPNDGTISITQAHSPPNSLLLAPAVDCVQTGNITSGQWTLGVWTFIPSGSVSTTDVAYIIVMNNYAPSPTEPNNDWSVQVALNKSAGMVQNANTNANAVPLVRDQWVLVEVLIDLAADTATVKYNGAVAYGPLPYSTANGAGLHAIACVDLFSNDGIGVYYDDVSLAPTPSPCYPNCDSSTTAPCLNVLDFSCFLNQFAAGATYANCDHSTTPPVLNVLDFSCFLNSFAAGCSSC